MAAAQSPVAMATFRPYVPRTTLKAASAGATDRTPASEEPLIVLDFLSFERRDLPLGLTASISRIDMGVAHPATAALPANRSSLNAFSIPRPREVLIPVSNPAL